MVIHKSGDALLACVGENTPDRDTFVFWDFNGTSLPLDNNKDFHHQSDFEYFQEQETLKVNFSLLIRNVTERDTGAYHCGVRTLKGNDSDTIYLSLVTPGICMNDYTSRPSLCVRALLQKERTSSTCVSCCHTVWVFSVLYHALACIAPGLLK